MSMKTEYDFIVIGAGSAGCAVAAVLAEREVGSVLLVEAGPSDRSPLVKMPLGLLWLIGSRKRDWRYKSAPQQQLAGRSIDIPRGRMLGGSGSINSMVWYRGREDDFNNWGVTGWEWSDVLPAFEQVEARLKPSRLATPHPVTEALGNMFLANDPEATPSPEHNSAGVNKFNMHGGRRWSAADAFLRPAMRNKSVQVITNCQISHIGFVADRAKIVHFTNGQSVKASRGIVLSAGSIGSTEILLNSGIGPAEDLRATGRNVVLDQPNIGANLHDHPGGVGIHYKGRRSGYGLHYSLAAEWAAAPFQWVLKGKGIFASPTVEGGAFFNSDGGDGPPDIQSHFIPFFIDWRGRRYAMGRGYFADVTLCRPKSRGRLRLSKSGLDIDLGLLSDPSDLDNLTAGWLRLRQLMDETDFEPWTAEEVYPACAVQSEDEVRRYIEKNCETAYHPVGTLRMGMDPEAPVTSRLKLRGVEGLWIADASIMPAITSANTNAPSMMIGYRAGEFIASDM